MNHLPHEIREMIYKHVVHMSRKSDAFKKELLDVWFLRQWKKVVALPNVEIGYIQRLIKTLPETLDSLPLQRMYDYRWNNMHLDYCLSVDETTTQMFEFEFNYTMWEQLLFHYITRRLGMCVNMNNDDPDLRSYKSIPASLSDLQVNVKIALHDYLESKQCLVVRWNNLDRVMKSIWQYNECTNTSTVNFMLRRYMKRYYTDLDINWCECSANPHRNCNHHIPVITEPFNNMIYVSILTLYCDFIAYIYDWEYDSD